MAKQSGKKKTFNYNLETILRIREIHEKQQQEKFATAQLKHQQERKKEKELKDMQEKKYDELRDSIDRGATLDFSDLVLRRLHLEKVAKDVEAQEKVRKKAYKKREQERNTLVEKVKDKKVIEKDKENKRADWQKEVKKEETKFIDDIATSRFSRQSD